MTQKVKKIKDRRFSMAADLGLKSNLGFAGFKKTRVYEILKPEVGVTWSDIGDPKFEGAPDNEQSISAGAAIHPTLWKLKNTVGLEFREINQERPFLTKLHFGIESQLPWILSIRGGLSQGYPTAGLSADFWIMKVDTAVYFEEIGIATREKGNLRLAATVSFNI
jgi:hypothetical protein